MVYDINWDELFNQLLYGTGSWIGVILTIGFMAIVTKITRWSSIVFIPILLFMGVDYFNKLASNSMFMWNGVLCFVGCLVLALITVTSEGD